MDDVTLYNLHNRGGTDGRDKDRILTLERAFARYLRSEGKPLREIAKLLDIRMADVKELL